MSKYRTISVTPETFDGFERLSKQYGINKGEFLSVMVKYFKETKSDPRDPKPIDTKSIESKIQATDKRIISFIKTQEKDILKPMRAEIDLIVKELARVDLLSKLKVINDNIVDIEEQLKKTVMVTNFGSPVKSQNSGSSAALANYLEKENEGKDLQEREYFFDSNSDFKTKDEVINEIDQNGQNQGMKKEQDRFYSFTINPSQEELKHINNDPEKLKQYTREVMVNYADNFGRGIEEKQLVWSAKVETERTYNHTDAEVKAGEKERGQQKEGEQTHVHVIVSRFTAKEQSTERTQSLSPLTNHRGTEKGIIKGGFKRTEFIQKNEKSFDKAFNYDRDLKERFEYNRANPFEKREMERQEQIREIQRPDKNQEIKIDREIDR